MGILRGMKIKVFCYVLLLVLYLELFHVDVVRIYFAF